MADYCEHDLSTYVGCQLFQFVTGSFSFNGNSGSPRMQKTAVAESAQVWVQLPMSRLTGEFGGKLKSISIPMRINTADLTGVIVGTIYQSLHGRALATPGTTINSVTFTTANSGLVETGTQVTNSANDRLYTATIANPLFDYNAVNSATTSTNISYWLSVVIPTAASTVLYVYDATVTYAGID